MIKTKSMQQETLQEAILNNLSIHRPSTIEELSSKLERHYNTIRHNVYLLREKGLAFCPNHKAKPQEWYAVRDTSPIKLSPALAINLVTVHEMTKSVMPSAVYAEVQPLFEAAERVMKTCLQKNKLSPIVKYRHKIKNINMQKLSLNGAISGEALRVINDSMYSESEILVQTKEGEFKLQDISLVEMNDELFVKGKTIGFEARLRSINVSQITSAESLKDTPAWRLSELAA